MNTEDNFKYYMNGEEQKEPDKKPPSSPPPPPPSSPPPGRKDVPAYTPESPPDQIEPDEGWERE